MFEYLKEDGYIVKREERVPVSIKDFGRVECAEEFMNKKPICVSFSNENVAKFMGRGAYVVLDYGKELCGGIRIVTQSTFGETRLRVTFGESLSECCSSIGEKNATNDHSPRDFEVYIPNMSDLTVGLTGFRFVRLELLTENVVWVQNVFGINMLPVFEREGFIKTSDSDLNRIIDTAIYTLKLNLQNGYIWDGIKRDRLVWCGDLHQEIINSIYLYGDNKNVTNSLSFLRAETPEDAWINNIPSYSAWWVINLCDYFTLTGNTQFLKESIDYAKGVMKHFDECIAEDGVFHFQSKPGWMVYFLDWPTEGTEDAIVGTAAIITIAAKRLLAIEENETCRRIIQKLSFYLDKPCMFKQTRAFQILAGRVAEGEREFLERDGADGFSTFMAYYILKADAMAGGEKMLSIIKEYFGAMLSRGATSFWEDFHVDWLEGSGSIDELPKEGEKDIHGDYGAYCYKGFRHSLCHGWASGVVAFVVEYMLGLKLINGGETYEITPHMMGVKELEARIPLKDGWLSVKVTDGEVASEIKR